jgi:Na+-transporting NADH:ubiquinone oxidoreductase subunit NqrD
VGLDVVTFVALVACAYASAAYACTAYACTAYACTTYTRTAYACAVGLDVVTFLFAFLLPLLVRHGVPPSRVGAASTAVDY